MVGQRTRAGSHFIKFRREAWCCRGASQPYAPVALFPNGAPGEGAMSTLFIVSAAALSAMAGPLRSLSLPYEHEDRGADVRNQEKADERGGERKTEFEREQFGCIGGAAAEHCHGHPLFVGIGFPPNPAGTGCPPGCRVNVRGHTRPLTRHWDMRLARNNMSLCERTDPWKEGIRASAGGVDGLHDARSFSATCTVPTVA